MIEGQVIKELLELSRATDFLSYKDSKHPLYQELLRHKKAAIPVLLTHLHTDRSFDNRPDGCWWAMMAIRDLEGFRDSYPVKEENRGRLDASLNDYFRHYGLTSVDFKV